MDNSPKGSAYSLQIFEENSPINLVHDDTNTVKKTKNDNKTSVLSKPTESTIKELPPKEKISLFIYYCSCIFRDSVKIEQVRILEAKISPLEKMEQLTEHFPEMAKLTKPVEAAPAAGKLLNDSIGKKLYPELLPEQLIELNRTIVCLLALSWVLKNDYESFIGCQPEDPNIRLSPESFNFVRNATLRILKDTEAVHAMLTSLAINDLGKITYVKEMVEDSHGKQVDHDAILYVALNEFSWISPNFQRLSCCYQDMMLRGLQTDLNVGQLAQAECVPASLEKAGSLDPDALMFHILHAFFDIAGAKGQFDQNGCLLMTEPIFRGFQVVMKALQELKQSEKSEHIYKLLPRKLSERIRSLVRKQRAKKIYDWVLSKRAEQLKLPTDFKDQKEGKRNFAVARLACMSRVDEEKAQIVRNIFIDLPVTDQTKTTLLSELSRKGTDDGKAILLYYAPALLENIRHTAGTLDWTVQEGIKLGLHKLAEIFQEQRDNMPSHISMENGVKTVNIRDIAEQAKDGEVLKQWRTVLFDNNEIIPN